MGTRGFKTVRHRGRYYCFYTRYDSYPEGLGKKIQSKVPTNPEAYAKWLAEQREEYEILHKQLEEYLNARNYDAGEEPRINGRSAARPQLDTRPLTMCYIKNLPTYLYESISEHDTLWDYVVDLDREVFTINNSAHMKLDSIPKCDWIQALTKAACNDHIILPGLVPKDCIADLVLKTDPTPMELINLYDSLGVTIVKPKAIADIPFPQRHGLQLCARIFEMFQGNQEDILERVLLGWNADDFCFREIVFAILCIASPGRNLSLVKSRRVLDSPEAGYFDIVSFDLPEKVSTRKYYSDDDSYNTGDSESDGENESRLGHTHGDHDTKVNDDDDDDNGSNTSTMRASSELKGCRCRIRCSSWDWLSSSW